MTLPELLADTDMLAQVIQYHCTEAGQLLKSRLEEGQLVMVGERNGMCLPGGTCKQHEQMCSFANRPPSALHDKPGA